MEPWSSSYRSFEAGRASNKNMEIVTVQKGAGIVNTMFVGRSRARPLDLLAFPASHGHKKSNKKKGSRSSGTLSWWNDPEMKRRRRVAKYKLYSVEGRFKASIKRGFHWIKHKCSEIAHRF